MRTAPLLGRDRTYLEGVRLANTATLTGTLDYWRIYEAGVALTVESYREDWVRAKNGGAAYVSTLLCLFRLHSILAHARLLGQELPGVHQVLVRQDWRGMSGRSLAWDDRRFVSPLKVADDRFAKTTAIPWAELRDDYFVALRRLALPFFSVFANPGWLDPETWLTRNMVERELAKFRMQTVRLFEG